MKTIRTMVAAAVLVVLGGAMGCAGSAVESSTTDCHAICEQAAVLKCSDTDDVDACKGQCDEQQGGKCASQFNAYVSCLGGITLKCDEHNEVDTTGCVASQNAYFVCAFPQTN